MGALRSPYIANLVDSWVDEHGEGWLVLERGGIQLDEYLDEVESLTDATRSSILVSINASLLFLYREGYIAHIEACSFMQFGDSWKLVDLFDCIFAIETVDDPAQRDLFSFAQSGLVQGLVDGGFSSLQLPAFSSLHLGLITVEILLSSPLFEGHTSQAIYDMMLSGGEGEDLTGEEFKMLDTLQIIVSGWRGHCTEEEAIIELGSLIQDYIMPSFMALRSRHPGGPQLVSRRHYFSRF